MAVDKMSMSLEEIIKLEKPKGNFGGRNFQRRGGRRGQPRSQGQPRQNFGIFGGGVQNRRNLITSPRTKVLPDVWKHDLYQEDKSLIGIPRTIYRSSDGTMSRSPAILHISNLDYGVSDTDIKELFGEFGTLLKAAIHYDRSGRSLGNAEVEFENKSDAMKAIKQYNNVPLDGKPMKIVFLNENNNSQNTGGRSLQGRVGPKNDYEYYIPPARQQFRSRQNFSSNRVSGRGASRGGGNRRNNKIVPSKEDLDAELDNYNSKMEE